jgi:soluble lytic murein transglycosylase-like protein
VITCHRNYRILTRRNSRFVTKPENWLKASKGLVIAGAALLYACAQAQPITRYQCFLLDGSTLSVSHDLQKSFPSAAQCVPLAAVAATTAAPFVTPRNPAPSGTTWINAPNRKTAQNTKINAQKAIGFFGLSQDLARTIEAASLRQELDPVLVAALIYTESRYRSSARSPKGALGLMQIMPATARDYGVSDEAALLNPQVNLHVGTQHLRMLHQRYGKRLDLILAAYNAGEGAVSRYREQIPPYPETQAYVRDILDLLEQARNSQP